MRIGRRIVTTLVIAVFLFQFIFVHLLSFHIIFHERKWAGAVQQSASFRITNTLIPVGRHRYDEAIKIMDKIATLARTDTLIITDAIGKIGASVPLTYYVACKAFPNPLVSEFYSLDYDYSPLFRKSMTQRKKWDIFLAKTPEYYITLKTTKSASMDNDNRIFNLVQKSTQFEEVSSPECPSLVIYRYKGKR